MQSKSAIVSFSGGQDSTTCLFWALSQYDHVETVGFNYGQKNNIELVCRQNILSKIKTQFPQFAEKLGYDLVIDASTFGQVSASALTSSGEEISATGARGLPSSFVPARNLLGKQTFFFFLTADETQWMPCSRRSRSAWIGPLKSSRR